MDTNTIRKQFINFFQKKGHFHKTAVPIVNQGDPDLFFVNAGMNPFKNIFLGDETPKHKALVSHQPCLRVTGKHNDLEQVGVDTYHHTLFEMLGNWSFGGYFKKEAIASAWELLTQIYGIDSSRLYATVFCGEAISGLQKDHESYAYWQTYLPKEHIIHGLKKDNFWQMGPTGPCGPCTELHIDIRDKAERQKTPGSKLVNTGHPKLIELWNIVFIQYNQNTDGTLTPLPQQHVDTGIGLERLAMVLQNKTSTYDTDIFAPLLTFASHQLAVPYGENPKKDIALRVIIDHLRAITFAIADGLQPSNQKAGYIIRRILRRALRYGHTHLGLQKPFLHELVYQLTHHMHQTYPYLNQQKTLIKEIIYQEELHFIKTLAEGIHRLQLIIDHLPKNTITIPGINVFELYDTYGFPPDLTALIAREQGLIIDQKGFDQAMQQQKTRSKPTTPSHLSDWHQVHNHLVSKFVGYDQTHTQTKIIKYRPIYQQNKHYYQIILNNTPCYPESGGQIGDTGYITTNTKQIQIVDTQLENNLIVHYTTELPDNIQQTLTCTIHQARRKAISTHHTATHLMLAAMIKILNQPITQQGSLIHEKALRFDFTYNGKIPPQLLTHIEQEVNQTIRANLTLNEMRQIPIQKAKNMGATATFGEKYGDKVRVISYGNYCIDLCGGTHVQATGELGLFKIKKEKSICSGIRRIEAVAGLQAEHWVQNHQNTLTNIGQALKNTQQPFKATQQLIAQHKETKQTLEKTTHFILHQQKQQLTQKLHTTQKGHYTAVEKIELFSAQHLKTLALSCIKTHQPLLLALGTILQGKAHLVIAISPQLTQQYQAQKIIQQILPTIQGKGGGQNHFALAHGNHAPGLNKALHIIKQAFKQY